MEKFQDFVNNLGQYKTIDIPFYYRNQFKIKENFINPNSKNFDQIAQKLLSEDSKGIKRKWDKQCKMLFIWIIVKFFQKNNKKTINPNVDEWDQLTTIFSFDENTLKQRWITLINPMSKSINWEKQEDDIIKSLMKEQEEKHIWTTIALELYNHNNGQYVRTPKQVRERWMNYLNPQLKKSSWQNQEDNQLLKLVITHGKRWSMIANLLSGRTENQVKNRFKSLMHKIYKEEEDDDIEEVTAIKAHLDKQDINHKTDQLDIKQSTILKNRLKKSQNKNEDNLIIKSQRKQNKLQTRGDIQEKQQQQEQLVQCEQELLNKQTMYPKKKQVKVIENNKQIKNQDIRIEEKEQLHILKQQFSLSTHATCDTKSQENRKDISTPASQLSLGNPEYERAQIKQQIPVISPTYTGFKPYSNEQFNDFFSQTPNQINKLGLDFSQKQNYNQSYPGISPFQSQIQQTPLMFTPLYFYNQQFLAQSPFRSPMVLSQSQLWMPQQQQYEIEIQNEIKDIEQMNNKLEFLEGNDLLSKWKNKRQEQKLTKQEQNSVVDQ